MLLPNDLDGTSAISFFFPSICDVITGHAFFAFSRSAIACTNCSPTFDCLDANLLIQLIDGVLSPNNATVFSVKSPPTPSTTNHAITIPAISRSEFVIRPSGFSAEFTFANPTYGPGDVYVVFTSDPRSTGVCTLRLGMHAMPWRSAVMLQASIILFMLGRHVVAFTVKSGRVPK